MALLELTPSSDTSEETFAFVRDFGTDVLGKTCVRSRDEAGFIVNRLLIPYLFDAIRLYASGFATREDIDTAMRLGLAHPMGPLALSDLIGLDTLLAIGEVLGRRSPAILGSKRPTCSATSWRRDGSGRSPAAGSTTPDRSAGRELHVLHPDRIASRRGVDAFGQQPIHRRAGHERRDRRHHDDPHEDPLVDRRSTSPRSRG